MSRIKVFIDGSEGTTGLRIYERFQDRDDLEILHIDSELRKDVNERKRLINESDYTFLCLPDDAAREAVSLVDNDNTVIIDASTAHRTEPGWIYGLPELDNSFRERIATSKRIAVPGCYASGFNMIVYPLVQMGIISPDYPLCVTALSGYSGAGKKAIAQYESSDKTEDLYAPREYALPQQHKHLKEMKAIPGLSKEPIFIPIVDDYYSGMIVNIPLHKELLKTVITPQELRNRLADYYSGQQFITVYEWGKEADYNGYLVANQMSGRDSAGIIVTGNEERMVVSSIFDNLGKGASGAAVQCLNISMGIAPDTGLVL